MVPKVEVVDDQGVDLRHSEALQAVLERAHDPIVTVVVVGLELQPAYPSLRLGRRIDRRTENPTDLGRQDHVVPRLTVEETANAVLALPVAIERSRVVVADALRPSRREGRLRVPFRDLDEKVAERRATEPQLRKHQVRASEFSQLEGIHAFFLPPRIFGAIRFS